VDQKKLGNRSEQDNTQASLLDELINGSPAADWNHLAGEHPWSIDFLSAMIIPQTKI
jgi:hypothetical protein